jgi:hypothetical protein
MTADLGGQTALEPNGESTTAQAAAAPGDDFAPASGTEATPVPESNGQSEAAPAVTAEPIADAVAEAPAPAAPVAEPASAAAETPAPAEPAAAPEQAVAAESAAAAEAPAAEQPAAAEPSSPPPAGDAVAEAPAAADATAEPAPPAVAVTPDVERPAVGPRILGVAAEPKPLPTVKATLPTRKRRRRPSAAERHRRAFFSALTELRRGGTMPTAAQDPAPSADEPGTAGAVEAAPPAAEAPVAEAFGPAAAAAEALAPEQPAAEAPAPAAAEAPGPAAEEAPAPAAEEAPAPAAEEPSAPGADRSPTSPARVTAAIERVGGAEVIKEALKPKQDEKGQPLKWAAVCAQSAEGMKPGDPVFNAWVRLAATPVREVKALLPRPPEAERSERGPGARRPGGQRSGGGRPRRDDRPSRSEFASHAQDGKLRTSIRIVTGHDEDQERRERERNRKEQREAKRRAERERLARLGY